MKKLLKNLHIVKGENVVRGSIGIEGERIAFVAFEDEEQKGAEIPADFTPNSVEDFHFQHLAFPSFFNAHTHVSMILLRNIADGLPLMEWLETAIWPIEAKLTGRDVYYGAMLGMAEFIHSGCTGFRDMYDPESKVADAVKVAGIRGYLGQGMILQSEDDMKKIDISEQLFRDYHNTCAEGGSHPRVKIEIAPHAPYTCTSEGMKKAKEVAERLGAYYHIHLSESDDEVNGSLREHGKTPTKRLYDLGVLNERTAAAHCAKMTDDDLDIMAKTGATVLLNPASNLKLGNGISRVKDMRARGVKMALGTDGASSNNNLNMLEELHLAALLYGESPAKTFETATLGGWKSAGEDKLGLIEKDYIADIAFLDLSGANLTPHGNLLSALCYSAAASDVSHLMVGGEYVMKNKKILTFDEEEIKREVRNIAEGLLEEIDDFK